MKFPLCYFMFNLRSLQWYQIINRRFILETMVFFRTKWFQVDNNINSSSLCAVINTYILIRPKQHTEWRKHLQTFTKQNYFFTMRWTIVVKIIVPVFPCFVSYSPAILKSNFQMEIFHLDFPFFFFFYLKPFLLSTINSPYNNKHIPNFDANI